MKAKKISAVITAIKNKVLSPQNNLASDWQLDALISHEHKLIIYTNPKCASGTIKIWFLQILGILPIDISIENKIDNILGKSIHEYIKENYKLYNYPKNQEYKYINYSKAIIVRNPWRRVVSFYCDKILIKENHLKSLDIFSQENYDKD
ncbi:MAG: sulfotransferase family 2 domain-containing protein [Methylococcaceae bacterium]|nr:sulfotransferase family 2 domain-containing protein [Methylococcaceae bacterium]